ncbi:hypothetical protein G5B37_13090 [Rasiella rasia]|uniref:CarboxypepD_reg-like domain-containing protein n=1 Tax=Rasiella rasia TaxID=2744027 RepID=A0A6G6GPR3_9FLAO|nr:hypothetical protein [Rasiella rasia]QIE60464.1 hypothetical protein G5B37_13090 [Rasiella rasia]
MKLLITSFLILFSLVCFSQQVERVSVRGEVSVPKGEEKDQISIYNESSRRGTVTDDQGKFELEVAAQDRILITALQFQSYTVVVTESVIENKLMKIYLNPYVNKLDVVILRNQNLTGDLEYDAKNTEVIAVPNVELSFDADADFAPDRFSRVEGNAAQEALGYGTLQNGVNFVSIIGVLAKALFPKKKSEPYKPQLKETEMVKLLQDKYSAAYYSETFSIPLDRVDDFIYFAGENAITTNMLKPENEVELLETLFIQSELYKARGSGE